MENIHTKIKVLELFSGINGFRLGIEQVDPNKFEFIGQSEIDKYALQISNKNYPNYINYGDITKINAKELPDFELLVGGFPCQSFSIAGKRGGFEDTRGTMFFEIARIVREKQPRLLLLENVKGLLSHDKGKTFITILSTLDELGYDIQWQVLNSKNFGVPQNRERVFIIGHLRGTSRPQVFPFGEGDKATSDLEMSGQTITKCLCARGQSDLHGSLQLIGQGNNGEIKKLGTYGTGNYQSGRQIYDKEGISPTLTAGMGMGGGTIPSIKTSSIRRLTPIECERLQGFPGDFTKYGISENGKQVEISDTQRYRSVGNAVSIPVIKAIAERLVEK